MGHSQALTFLLISALLLSISLHQGDGRRIKVVRHYDAGHSFKPSVEKIWVGREIAEILEDYQQPGANTNPNSGISPPPPVQP